MIVMKPPRCRSLTTQLDLWMRDRASTGRHPRSRWATQALVVAAGAQGSALADLVATRRLAPSTVRRHLRRLEQIGRVVRRDGRWFAATEPVTL